MTSDAEWIVRSLAGDGEAFVEVIRRHEAAVGAYLARRVGKQFAEDVLGEVWVAALASRRSYDRSFPDAGPWLFGVAHNTLRRHKPLSPEQQTDNQIWSNSLDALNAGAGNPQVRVGVFRLMSALPGITVTNTSTDGQPTLTLTHAWPAPSGLTDDVFVINAATGLPVVSMTRQPGGQLTGTTYYHVSRVTLSDIAAGKF
ncbi:MAG: RNA polymerase sigma factor [Streptosporangiaceae bacterium]